MGSRAVSSLGTGLLLLGLGCAGSSGEATREAPADEGPERLRFQVLRSYPHDVTSFTQGLLWHEGLLYESTGQYGESALIAWDPATGEVRQRVELPPELWGEGLALVGRELVQLTWKSGIALRWSLPLFERVGEHRYAGEGWGLALDPGSGLLVMSDGTHVLTLRDPRTFEVVDTLPVTLEGQPIRLLNELEVAQGSIFANVWTTERILRIDPGTGVVTAEIDASGLLDEDVFHGTDVLNGIAYRPETETFFVTGKLWPRVFEGGWVED